MPEDKPKRKKFVPPKPPYVQMRPDQEPIYGVGLRHERLVGRAVIEWARLEAVLNDLIWIFLGLSFEDGRVLTARADATTKIAILRSIVPRHLNDADKVEALMLALDAIDSGRDDRNFIVHGSWGTLEPEHIAFVASLRSKSKPEEVTGESFPPKRMYKIIQLVVEMRRMLATLYHEIEASPDTLLK